MGKIEKLIKHFTSVGKSINYEPSIDVKQVGTNKELNVTYDKSTYIVILLDEDENMLDLLIGYNGKEFSIDEDDYLCAISKDDLYVNEDEYSIYYGVMKTLELKIQPYIHLSSMDYCDGNKTIFGIVSRLNPVTAI